MHKIHNCGINIFGVVPLCQFHMTVFRGTPNPSIPIMPVFLPNSMFDHLLESSHRADSNKCSNIVFGEKIMQVAPIEVNFMHLIWSSDHQYQGVNFTLCLLAIFQAIDDLCKQFRYRSRAPLNPH